MCCSGARGRRLGSTSRETRTPAGVSIRRSRRPYPPLEAVLVRQPRGSNSPQGGEKSLIDPRP